MNYNYFNKFDVFTQLLWQIGGAIDLHPQIINMAFIYFSTITSFEFWNMVTQENEDCMSSNYE
jgi:hypothetical protein